MKHAKDLKVQECIIVSANDSDDCVLTETMKEQSSLAKIFNPKFHEKMQRHSPIYVLDRPKKTVKKKASGFRLMYPLLLKDIMRLGLENPRNLYTLYNPTTEFIFRNEKMFFHKPKRVTALQFYDLFRKNGQLFLFYILFRIDDKNTKKKFWLANLNGIPAEECQRLIIQYLQNLLLLKTTVPHVKRTIIMKVVFFQEFVRKYYAECSADFHKLVMILGSRQIKNIFLKGETISIINDASETVTRQPLGSLKSQREAKADAPFKRSSLQELRNGSKTRSKTQPKKTTKKGRGGKRKAAGGKKKRRKTTKPKAKAKADAGNEKKRKKKGRAGKGKRKEHVKDLKLKHFAQNFGNSSSSKHSIDLMRKPRMLIREGDPLMERSPHDEENLKSQCDQNKLEFFGNECQILLRQIPRVYLQNLNPDILGKLSLAQKKVCQINRAPQPDNNAPAPPETNAQPRTKSKEQVFYLPNYPLRLPLQSYMSQLVRRSPNLVYFNPEITPVCPLAEKTVSYFSFFDSTVVFLEEAKMLVTLQNSDFKSQEFGIFLRDVKNRIRGCFDYYCKNNLFITH